MDQFRSLEDLITEWKKEYFCIWGVTIKKILFIYREILPVEYESLKYKDMSDMERSVYICKTFTLYPFDFDFDNTYAGIPIVLSRCILESSGYVSVDEAENKINDKIQKLKNSILSDPETKINSIILYVFNSLRITDVMKMSFTEKMYYLSYAEFILYNLHGVSPQALQQVQMPTQQRGKVSFTQRDVLPAGFTIPAAMRR